MRNYIEVKLVQVNFVPTWVDEEGTNKRTLVGQAAIEASTLPEELQEALRRFILEGLNA